jgi:hypothetical protein
LVILKKAPILVKLLKTRQLHLKLLPWLSLLTSDSALLTTEIAVLQKNIYYLIGNHNYYVALALQYILSYKQGLSKHLEEVLQLANQYFKEEEAFNIKLLILKTIFNEREAISLLVANLPSYMPSYLAAYYVGDLEGVLQRLDPIADAAVWYSFYSCYKRFYQKDTTLYAELQKKHASFLIQMRQFRDLADEDLADVCHPLYQMLGRLERTTLEEESNETQERERIADEMLEVNEAKPARIKEGCRLNGGSTDTALIFLDGVRDKVIKKGARRETLDTYEELWLSMEPIIHFTINQRNPGQLAYYNDKEIVEVSIGEVPGVCHYRDIPYRELPATMDGHKLCMIRDKLKDSNNGIDLLEGVQGIKASLRRCMQTEEVSVLEGHPTLPFYVAGQRNSIVTLYQYDRPYALGSFSAANLVAMRGSNSNGQPARYERFTRLLFPWRAELQVVGGQYDGTLHSWDLRAASTEEALNPMQSIKTPLKHVLDVTTCGAPHLLAVVGPNMVQTGRHLLLYDVRAQPTLPAISFFTGSQAEAQPRVVTAASTAGTTLLITGGLLGELAAYDIRHAGQALLLLTDAHADAAVTKREVTSLNVVAGTLVSCALSGRIKTWRLSDSFLFEPLGALQYANRFLTPSAYFSNAYHLGHPHVRSKQHHSITWKALQILQQHALPLPPETHTTLNTLHLVHRPFDNMMHHRAIDSLTIYASGDDGAIRKCHL